MKNIFYRITRQISLDRLIVFLALVSSLIVIGSTGQLRKIIWIIIICLALVLLVRLIVYSLKNGRNRLANCHRFQGVTNVIEELAKEMNVSLHPTKAFKIIPALRGANALPRPFFSKRKIHFGGRIHVGCTILCGLDDRALRGIIAHELAHISKSHSLKSLPFYLIFLPILAFIFFSNTVPVVLILVTITLWISVSTLICWHDEYEADAIAAEYVGEENMIFALEQFRELIYRPGDTLLHPSFKKRISHLSSNT